MTTSHFGHELCPPRTVLCFKLASQSHR